MIGETVVAYLTARNIVQEFNGVRVLDGVDIDVERGKFHILAGENGAGKSTLVKILEGVLHQTDGQVRIDGKDPLENPELYDKIAFVPQELSLFQNLTVAENLFIPFGKHGQGGLSLNTGEIKRMARPFLEQFNIHAGPGERVSDISVSDQQLTQIARAVSRENIEILILDEPTSSLTTHETDRLFKVLRRLVKEDGVGVIFISHKMEEIFGLGEDITVLRNGRLVDRGEMTDLTEQELIDLMAGENIQAESTYQPSANRTDVVLNVENLSGAGFQNVSFELKRGEILGFAGLVGAGRSETMQGLFGYHPYTSGRVVLNGEELAKGRTDKATQKGMFYIPEERSLHGIFAEQGLHHNIALPLFGQTSKFGFISGRKEKTAIDDIIRDYGIKTSSRKKEIKFLSGGNQQKAIIGRSIARKPDVLIFDEPTKGIDVRTKLQIYGIMRDLADEGVGIILVSSEIEELQKCASRIITMREGVVLGEFETNNTDKNTLIASMLGMEGSNHVH